jgi:hypothetical protein
MSIAAGHEQAVSQIEGAANEVFDRVKPRIDRYAADPRRVAQDGSVILAHNSFLTDPEAYNGNLKVKICNPDSRLEVVTAYNQSSILTDDQIDAMNRSSAVALDPENWTDKELRIRLLSGRSLTRHGFGILFESRYQHKELPLKETHFWSSMAETDGVLAVGSNALKRLISVGGYTYGDKWHDSIMLNDHLSRIEQLTGLLQLAKDLRPDVSSPKQIQNLVEK